MAGTGVLPYFRVSPTAGGVGGAVSVSLELAGESVLITFDAGSAIRRPARVTTSASGAATATFGGRPVSVGGARTVSATGPRGTTASTTFTVDGAGLSDSSLAEEQSAVLTVLGYDAGEVVTFRWDAVDGPKLGTDDDGNRQRDRDWRGFSPVTAAYSRRAWRAHGIGRIVGDHSRGADHANRHGDACAAGSVADGGRIAGTGY